MPRAIDLFLSLQKKIFLVTKLEQQVVAEAGATFKVCCQPHRPGSTVY